MEIRRYVKRGVSVALATLLIVPSLSVSALEIQGDSVQYNNNNEADYTEDNPEFSQGGMLIGEEGEFFIPETEMPATIGNANNVTGGQVFNVQSVVPESYGTADSSNTYVFKGDGVLENLKGEKTSTLWEKILRLKEIAVALEMEQIHKEGYKSLTISGDLDTKLGDSLWIENASTLFSRYNNNMTVRLSTGAQNYYILLDGSSANQMQWTFQAFDQYKDAIRMGVIAGSMKSSYNVYTLYSSTPILLNAILDPKSDGSNEVKSHTNVNYTAQYFLNPLFGKMSYDKVMEKGKTETDFNLWSQYVPSINLFHVKGNKLMFALNSQYHAFISKTSAESVFLSPIKDMSNLKGNGLKKYKLKYTDTKFEPQNLSDSSLYITTPSKLYKKVDSSKYSFTTASFKVNFDMKYSASTNHVYTKTNNEWKKSYTLSELGMKPDRTMLYAATVNGVTLGSITPLDYKEMIIDPANGKKYFTGRQLVFGGQFYEGMGFEEANGVLMSVKTDLNTDAEKLKNFSFPEDSVLTSATSHAVLDGTGSVIQLQTEYKPPKGKDITGALVYRNNQYAEDEKLLTWLQTDNAKALVGVEAEELYALIKGVLELDQKDMTYEEYLRLQEIKGELAYASEKTWLGVVNSVSLWLGFLLIFYGVVLGMLFLLDQVNPLSSKSILRFATLGRMQGVMYRADLEYMQMADGGAGTKILVWWQVLLVSTFLIGVGVLMAFTHSIVKVILWLFEKGSGFFVWIVSLF